MSRSKIVFYLMSSISLVAWADLRSSIPSSVQLYVSTRGGWSGSVAAIPPTASFASFPQQDVGRYFTLAIGPEYTNLLSRRSASFTGQLARDKCQVLNSPLPITLRSWDSSTSLYQTQTHQLKTCVRARVHDSAGVRVAPEQTACQVERVSENEVISSGGVCYFQISPASHFSVSYELNPSCTDATRFTNLGLGPLDIPAFAGFYVSGDATGRSSQLKNIGATALRFTIEPSEPSVRLSADMGQGAPRWPVVAYPDVHMGEFGLSKRDDASRPVLNTKVFTQNMCQDEGNPECQFGFPLGMLFNLKEIHADGRASFLEQWYAGGLAPAFWQGFLPASRELSFDAFRMGHRYRIEADLTYMSLYFRLFRDGFKNWLVGLGLLKIDPDQPLLPLKPIASLPGFVGLSPSGPVPDLQPLTPSGSNDLSLELNRLRSLLTDVTWPPFYERMCSGDACVRALEGESRLRIGVDFTFDGIEDGQAKTSNYRVWRQSAFLPEYDQNSQNLMRPACE